MIKSLKIKNVALIKEQNIEFYKGLNVFSGETGAGKSIIINALNFALGERADKTLIKNGEEFASVQVYFDNINSKTKEILKDFDLPIEDEMVILRKMTIDNKNDIKINGENVTLSMLKKITETLVDIYGQFEQSSLLNQNEHIKVLDAFNKEINKESQELNAIIEIYNNFLKQKNELGGDQNQRQDTIDFLTYQVAEIESINPRLNEFDELCEQKITMQNFEKISTYYKTIIENFENSEFSILNAMSNIQKNLSSLALFDKEIVDINERFSSNMIEIEDILETLQDKSNGLQFNEKEFEAIDNRHDDLKLLNKKYGGTTEKVLEFKENAKQKLNNLLDSEQVINNIDKEIEKIWIKIVEKAKQLCNLRKTSAKEFEEKIITNLADLSMTKAQFKVDIKWNDIVKGEHVNCNSFNQVEFLFSANLGQPLKPLAKIISGGEMSRFMLSVKSVLRNAENLSTLVFDEIDAGISGKTGQSLAIKLKNLSKDTQIITISHLAHIIAIADKNYLIAKKVEGNDTVSSVKLIEGDDKIKELTRIVGGNESDNSINFAKELKAWGLNN